ncbi:MAG: hypothetical protein ACXWUM_00065 [Burkholderiaceae bacterium]
MAGTRGHRDKTASAETDRSTDDAREELKRTLERDTAVQGEQDDESPSAAPDPCDGPPTTARPALPGQKKKDP